MPLWAWDSLTWNTESIPTRSLFTWWHMDKVQNAGFYPVFYRSIGVITTIAAKENNNNAWLRLCSIVNRGKTNLSWTRTWSFPKRFGFRFLLGTSICHVVFFFRKLHAYCDEPHVAARCRRASGTQEQQYPPPLPLGTADPATVRRESDPRIIGDHPGAGVPTH